MWVFKFGSDLPRKKCPQHPAMSDDFCFPVSFYSYSKMHRKESSLGSREEEEGDQNKRRI